jgi:O-antigen/teichoic acid export membrane protein
MLFSGSMLAQVVGFGALFFLGRWYSPESFGDLEVFLRLTGIFVAIAGLRYEMAIVVEDSDENAVELTRLSLYLNTAVSVLLFLVALVFAKPLANLFHLQNAYVIYFIPLVIWLTASTETLVLFRNRKKQYAKISTNRVATSFSATCYKLAHNWVFSPLVNGLVVGQILGQVVGFLQMTYRLPFKLFEYNKLAFNKLARKYKMFPMFSMPAALLNILATSMPFFIISELKFNCSSIISSSIIINCIFSILKFELI